MGDAYYLIPAVLALLTFAWWPRRIPAKVYGFAAIALFAVSVWGYGWMQAGLAALCSLLVVATGVFTRLLQRNTTFGVAAVGIGIPFFAWWILLPGLLVAVVLSTIKLRRGGGKGYVTMVAGETLAGLGYAGVDPARGGMLPDVSRIPVPDRQAATGVQASRVALMRWIALGAGLSVVVLVVAELAR